jgi:AAA domain
MTDDDISHSHKFDPFEKGPPDPPPPDIEPPDRGAPPIGEKIDKTTTAIKLIWHGEDDDESLEEWLVEEMFYQTGVGLVAGQWGLFKTFVVGDLAGSVMTKTPFAGRAVLRQGGVLFIAAEGQGQVKIRIRGLAMGKVAQIEPSEDAVKIDPDRMPIAWVKSSPRLSDPETIKELRALFAHTAQEMEKRFNLPLALVIIDALMPAAQFRDANDATEARQVMDMLAALGREFNLLVLPVDHFGKDVSTGTRNSSGKEDAADSILALLGERSIEGQVTNPRMALRKVKGAEQGIVFPFKTREIVVGERDGGRPIKTFVIDWLLDGQESVSTKQPKAWPKSLQIFKRALDKILGERGKRLRPFNDGQEVLAVPATAVRAEFLKAYPAENDDPKAKPKPKTKPLSVLSNRLLKLIWFAPVSLRPTALKPSTGGSM